MVACLCFFHVIKYFCPKFSAKTKIDLNAIYTPQFNTLLVHLITSGYIPMMINDVLFESTSCCWCDWCLFIFISEWRTCYQWSNCSTWKDFSFLLWSQVNMLNILIWNYVLALIFADSNSGNFFLKTLHYFRKSYLLQKQKIHSCLVSAC
jgi:hypothetical protein